MKNNSENLTLWNSVSTTEVKYTKNAKKGAHQFTSITPVYQFKMATEAFGPQGLGWGVVIGSEVFNETAYGTTILLTYDAVLYFHYNGERGEIPIHASEKVCYQTQGANGYMKIDDEVRKKVVTNAKTKGLSELGFNADIFMGEFNDPNYLEYVKFEQSINDAENKQDEIAKKTEELNEWCRKEITVYASIKDQRTLDLVLVQHKNKLQGRCQLLGLNQASYFNQFDKAYNERLTVINENKEKTNGK